MFQRLTDSAQQVLVKAQECAQSLGHEHFGTEHLLIALLQVQDGVGACALRCLYGVREPSIRREIQTPKEKTGVSHGPLPVTVNLKAVLKKSLDEANQFKSIHIDTEHILLALVSQPSNRACQILKNLRVNIFNLRSNIIDLIVPLLGGEKSNRAVLQAYSAMSDQVKTFLALAQKNALATGHNQLRSEHLVLSLCLFNEGPVRLIFDRLKIPVKDLEQQCRWALSKPTLFDDSIEVIPMTQTTKDVIEFALEESTLLADDQVEQHHILLGLLRIRGGPTQELLHCFGLTLENVRQALTQPSEPQNILKDPELQKLQRLEAQSSHNALRAYCINIAEKAAPCSIPRIARPRLNDQLTRLLDSKQYGVIVLKGSSGSGKTSFIERFSLDLAVSDKAKTGPPVLWKLKANCASSLRPQQWRARLVQILKDVKRRSRTILFIDDPDLVDQFFGPNSTSLFPSAVESALQRGRFKLIISTNSAEQSQWIERSSLGKISLSFHVPSTDMEETLEIVRSYQSTWFSKHKVTLTEDMMSLFISESNRKRPTIPQPSNVLQVVENAALHTDQTPSKKVTPLGRAALHDALMRLKTPYDSESPRQQKLFPPGEQRESQLLFPRDLRTVTGNSVFVVSSENKAFRQVYDFALKPIFHDLKLKVIEGPDIFAKENRYGDYWDSIREAGIVLADVSKHNPGTLYLLGLCHGLGRSPLLIVESEEQLPEHLRPLRYFEYGVKEQRLDHFKKHVKHELEQRLQGHLGDGRHLI